MTDPTALREALAAAADAFGYTRGEPVFEPGVNAAPDAADGEVQIQKACRLLQVAADLDDIGAYYGAMLEHSFIAIEHTLQGYLLATTGADAAELRDHTSPYEFGKGQVPLDATTLDTLQTLYDARRTEHYYGTTVTTREQAERMRDVATIVHRHIVTFAPGIEQFCRCTFGSSHRE